ncbi:DUF1345 domain-containing protein [soil metagenome]
MPAASKASRKPRVLGGHWRAPLAGVVGVASGFGVSLFLKPGASILIGWDVAALVFLVTTGWMLLTDDEDDLRHRACQEDEGRPVLTAMILGCVAFAFAAVIIALRESHSGGPKAGGGDGGQLWLSVLAIGTLVLSWLCVQALFTLHYAHRYFGDADANGKTEEGFQITGDKPRTYRDFIYMAVCIGACFQVSDFGPTNTTFRNLITVHALVSFAFNALVISLGVGIVGDLLKG